MVTNADKLPHNKILPRYFRQLSEQKKNVKKTIPYPAHATYALTRRLIVPRWWIESLLYTLGKKHAWYENFLDDRVDQRIYEYFKVTSTNVFLMFFIWHELTKFIFSGKEKIPTKIRLDLTPFLRGTEKQKDLALNSLEENLIKPSKIFDITAIDKQNHRELVIQQKGFVNVFRQISLEKNVNGIWLTLHFAQKLANLFVAPDSSSSTKTTSNSFISINPNLFYGMGSRVNLQTALNGLFLEYQKQAETTEEEFTFFKIKLDKADLFHSQIIKTTKFLFDHGMIRGYHNLPSTKISQLKQTQQTLNPDKDSSVVFSWNISGQTKEARRFEILLSQHLAQIRMQNSLKVKQPMFSEPPCDELQKIRDIQTRTIQNVPLHEKEPPDKSENYKSVNRSINAPNTKIAITSKHPNFHSCTERELSIFVARFYESLNQKQKKMFESERKRMNNEQFRAFMIPILQRTHTRLPT